MGSTGSMGSWGLGQPGSSMSSVGSKGHSCAVIAARSAQVFYIFSSALRSGQRFGSPTVCL